LKNLIGVISKLKVCLLIVWDL